MTPRHDVAYLQATEQGATYSARVAASAGVAQALATSFTPLDKANFSYDGDSMPATGYQEPIGLLPQHDALYLTCDSPNVYGAVLRNGYAAGRYPLYYRDEKTQRPIRFSDYPNLVLNGDSRVSDLGGSSRSQYTPKPSGTQSPKWDCAHSPSVGYMAYLLTGRWYFMEQVQFATTLNYLTKADDPAMRRGALGLVQPCFNAWQTRACAWQWRALTQALSVTPDNDTALRQEFINCVQSNIENFHATYVAQPNNPYGWVQPGEGYQNNMQFGASWQQDFVTAAFGYSLAMGLPVSATAAAKLDAFFRWKARSAVMRMGPASGFWYVNAVQYTASITPVGVPDFQGGKGPWYPNDAAVYAATYASVPSWFGKTEGTLAGEIMPGDRAAWGNLTTALAYAVRHGVDGAMAAYQRLVTASNYPALRDAFHLAPVWSVAPARIMPAWLAGKAVGEWFEIPGTSGAGGAAVEAYSGMAINELISEIVIAAAGGRLLRQPCRLAEPRLRRAGLGAAPGAQRELFAERRLLRRWHAGVAAPLQLDPLRAPGQPADAVRRTRHLRCRLRVPEGRCIQPRHEQMGPGRQLGRHALGLLRCGPDPRDRRGAQHGPEEMVARGPQVDRPLRQRQWRLGPLARCFRLAARPGVLPAMGRRARL